MFRPASEFVGAAGTVRLYRKPVIKHEKAANVFPEQNNSETMQAMNDWTLDCESCYVVNCAVFSSHGKTFAVVNRTFQVQTRFGVNRTAGAGIFTTSWSDPRDLVATLL